jgi:hypothetical protein
MPTINNRVQHYFRKNRPVLRKEFYLIHDLIDLFDDAQKGEFELEQFHDRVQARIRQYVWEAKVTPFIWQWTPIDRAHEEHLKESRRSAGDDEKSLCF